MIQFDHPHFFNTEREARQGGEILRIQRQKAKYLLSHIMLKPHNAQVHCMCILVDKNYNLKALSPNGSGANFQLIEVTPTSGQNCN